MDTKDVNKDKGITLIALIVTIIVLLVMSITVIVTLLGKQGIINKAVEASLDTKLSTIKEKILFHVLGSDEWPLEKNDNAYIEINKLASLEDGTIKTISSSDNFKEYDIENGPITLYNTIFNTEDNPYTGKNIGQKFYIVDVSKLEGYNYKEGKRTTSNDDVMIMAQNTHNVYYAEGVYRIQDTKYHGGRQSGSSSDSINGGEKLNFPLDKPGTYSFTTNAGGLAKWLALKKYDEYIPSGASINYKLKTSNDKNSWNEYDSIASIAEYSQYLKVEITITPNENGECPSLGGLLIKFKRLSEDEVEEIKENPAVDIEIKNVAKLDKNSSENVQNMDGGYGIANEKTKAHIVQKMTLSEPMTVAEINDNIDVPINKNNGKTSTSESNSIYNNFENANTIVYVSKDLKTWTSTSNAQSNEEYNYVQVVTDLTRNENNESPTVGIVSINPIEENVANWITSKTQYYYAQAEDKGKWISIEKEEEIPEGTKIIYSFAKSNDGENWSDYSSDILKNNNSLYIKVKVEYQKKYQSIKKDATMSNLQINYEINGKKSKIIPKEGLSYEIKYNLTGGTGEIADDVKKQDKDYTVTYVVPKKDLSTFWGWTTVEDSQVVEYDSGSKYSLNKNTTFYAIWKDGYPITYDANGGTNAPTEGIKIKDQNYTIPTNVPIKNGYTFAGWSENSASETYKFKVGDTFNENRGLKLFATWINNNIDTNILGTVTADSIQDATEKYDFADGRYIINVNGKDSAGNIENKTYKVEVINKYGNIVYTENPIIGDISNDDTMLIMKYHNNLTINKDITFTPYARKKGMFINVQGIINNYGTITMTGKGAIATGENVYLYKNSSGSFEYVPAIGVSGAGPGYGYGTYGGSQGGTPSAAQGRSTGGGGRRSWTIFWL